MSQLAQSLCGFLLCFALIALGLGSSVAPAHAQVSEAEDREARKLFEAGQLAFAEGRYERALKYFEESHALSQRHILLYNIGTARDRLGQSQSAIDAYREYLSKVPAAKNQMDVMERIHVLEIAVADEALRRPVMTPNEAARTDLARHDDGGLTLANGNSQSERTPVYKKWWLWTSIGVVVVAGVTVGIVAAAQKGDGGTRDPLVINDMTRIREL